MSGESNTGRGSGESSDDRYGPGRAQQSQPPVQPNPADAVAPGWRGGSSWLNPAAGAPGADSRPASPDSVSEGGSAQTSGPAASSPPGTGYPAPAPRPSAAEPPAPGHPAHAPRPPAADSPTAPHRGPAPEPQRPQPQWPAADQPTEIHRAPAAEPQRPGPDPAGSDFATQQLPRPAVANQAPGAYSSAGPETDAPTEVFDSAPLTERLSEDPAPWPAYSADTAATDALGERGPVPPPPPKGPRPGGSGGDDGSGGPLSGARTLLRDSASARRILLVAAVVFGIALVGYIADLVMTSGKVPRGVEVAGVAIGGMEQDAARAKLQGVLDARSGEVVPVKIADVQTQLVPGAAGLGVDWAGTWDRVGGQPLNPAARLLSFVATREVTVASTVDEAALTRTFDELRVHDQPPVEGGIAFEGTRPVAVNPVPGRILDLAAARTVLTDRWATASTLDLPVTPAPPAVRRDAIEAALHQIAEPAVSAPVAYSGKGNATATLNPEQIAAIVSFVPDGHGGLRVEFDHKVAQDLLAPQLAPTEVEPKDATFTFSGAPTVVPAVVGDKINWAKSLEQLPAMLAAAGAPRTTPAIYERIEPKLTTQAAESLGITEVVGEFTTSGFSGPSGVNIRTVAQEVNGAVVKPGDTFSLNGHTGHRGAAEGYVESGIIDHGRPSKAVGGGISQFATTLYNAAYFAGLEDAGHTEHSYYISRYPAAREATVFDGAIDLQFRNNSPHGVYIQAFADSSEVTVRIWGTKTVNVESITGEKTKPTEPETITLPAGDDCIASTGAPGFTISDTRVITDINTGQEISRHTRTVKYDPVPEVKCVSPDDEKSDEESPETTTPAPTTTPSSGNEGSRPTTNRAGNR
ncbi:VanW family protein [Nocardia sp. CA-290969]|uniref:VanW family protein n=1 Tax=Nocardia sp. CA-290969 TaxID=3239986 RepID=UPI003D90D78D